MVALVSGISPVDPIANSCLLCSACRSLLIKPKQTECGHRYCTACLENLFRTGNEADCYICQKKVLRSKVYLDRAAENDTYAAKIHCPAHLEGCDWEGSLRNYLRTHRAQCGFHVVPCANVAFGCEAVGPRREIEGHESRDCKWRLECCPRCQAFCVHDLLEDHVAKCQKQETCPHCGLTDLTKTQLEQHCDPIVGDCAKLKMACPFKEVGCSVQLPRHAMDAHLRTAQESHLLLLLTQATSQRPGTAEEGGTAGEGQSPAEGETAPGAGQGLASQAGRADELQRQVSCLDKDLGRQARAIELLQQKCLHYEQVIQGLQRKGRAAEGPGGPAPVSTNGVLVWKITGFSAHLAAAKAGKQPSFYSAHFASHTYGYRLCCRIYPDGDGAGKGSHISLFLALVRGDYDEVLAWPFRQKVTFLLLDQAGGQKHLKESFSPDSLSGSFQKPRSHMNVASGCPTFAHHGLLRKGPAQYLRDDTIYVKFTGGRGLLNRPWSPLPTVRDPRFGAVETARVRTVETPLLGAPETASSGQLKSAGCRIVELFHPRLQEIVGRQ